MQKYARVKSCEKVLLERFMVDSRLISSQVLEEFVWWCVSCTYLFTICWVKTQKYWRKKDALFWYEWRKRTCLLLYDAKKLIFLKFVFRNFDKLEITWIILGRVCMLHDVIAQCHLPPALHPSRPVIAYSAPLRYLQTLGSSESSLWKHHFYFSLGS